MTYFFGFYGPKIGGGGPPTRLMKISQTLKFGFLPALGWSCRTVLHTSVPAYRGFSTEIALLLGFSCPKIRMGGVLPTRASPLPEPPPRDGRIRYGIPFTSSMIAPRQVTAEGR